MPRTQTGKPAKETKTKPSNDAPKFIQPNQFVLKNLIIKPIDDKFSQGQQWNAFPRYIYSTGDSKMKVNKDGENFVVLTNSFKLKGGIPRLGGEHIPTDAQRQFFWLGDDGSPACKELFDMLETIDDDFDERINIKKNKDTIMKSNKDGLKAMTNLKYERMVRMSNAGHEDDDNDKEKYGEPYRRVKVKFNIAYDNNVVLKDAIRPINTKLFLGKNRKHENISTVPEFEQHLVRGCTAQYVLMFSKLWVQKAGDKKCSFSLKCVQVIVHDKPETKQSIQDQFASCVLGSGDGEDDNKSQNSNSDSESESESDNESESESEAEVKDSTKNAKGNNKDQESESEDESSDNDDSDDEDEEDSSDESSEEEEQTPPPKPVKGSKSQSKTPTKAVKKSK